MLLTLKKIIKKNGQVPSKFQDYVRILPGTFVAPCDLAKHKLVCGIPPSSNYIGLPRWLSHRGKNICNITTLHNTTG